MSATKTQRVFILFLAFFFAASTVGIVFYYVSVNKQGTQITQEVTPLNNTTNTTKLENYQPVSSVSSLQTIDLVAGSGETVQPGATVTVNYTGALASTGVVFESSYDIGQSSTFGLDQVITGWTQGIPGMQVGGTRRLLIPAALAYGANSPSPDIPANADLVFDVELISIN
jgi:FKBP-type peptidyl-prolyl cis-trans isomerase